MKIYCDNCGKEIKNIKKAIVKHIKYEELMFCNKKCFDTFIKTFTMVKSNK